ncbi:hypothetical protein Acsp04_32810 [Actinomadura sp. NBRC 104425]|uniref:hypothetical protein n=1 Tax=Actinomadura sp. NBRC 104425 TaxID=3032204 RepID=UPI0024A35C11|nr:hypothetical protein [Actinomadura sp. NBRC 104425]GLZ13046.1 hypothetical protein Acsp04_32810 [Actinomadura sp. NBRC 104425]
MTMSTRDGRTRHLVCHDYGMGGMWWWVWAASPEEVVTTFAETEVVTEPELIARAREWDLHEADVDDPAKDDVSLSEMRARRDRQRRRPGFGALAGHERVYLRTPGDWDPSAEEPDGAGDDGFADYVFLTEHGPDGRRIRQVEIRPDGEAVASDETVFPLNPPIDLYDPALVPMVIDAAEFEEAWRRARFWTDADWG